MAAITPLSGITWLAAEIAAAQTIPHVTDLNGMQSAMVVDLQELVKNVNDILVYLPAGTNKTTLTTLVTTLS